MPSAATPATAEPEISAKNIEAPTVTIARPPRMKPSIAVARLISRREIVEAFMMPPAKMNSGTASSGKLVAPSNITSATFGSMLAPCAIQIAATATTPSATATGTLISTSANIPISMRPMVMGCAPFPLPPGRGRRIPALP